MWILSNLSDSDDQNLLNQKSFPEAVLAQCSPIPVVFLYSQSQTPGKAWPLTRPRRGILISLVLMPTTSSLKLGFQISRYSRTSSSLAGIFIDKLDCRRPLVFCTTLRHTPRGPRLQAGLTVILGRIHTSISEDSSSHPSPKAQNLG